MAIDDYEKSFWNQQEIDQYLNGLTKELMTNWNISDEQATRFKIEKRDAIRREKQKRYTAKVMRNLMPDTNWKYDAQYTLFRDVMRGDERVMLDREVQQLFEHIYINPPKGYTMHVNSLGPFDHTSRNRLDSRVYELTGDWRFIRNYREDDLIRYYKMED